MDLEAAWAEEAQKIGVSKLIEDRLRFHGGLHLSFASRFVGCAKNTAKKHLDRLVEQGKATRMFRGDDWFYRNVA